MPRPGIEHLAPWAQRRVQEILAAEDAAKAKTSPLPPADKPAPSKKGPNATESAYRSDRLAGLDARFEGLTINLANGHRYTPDWVVFSAGAPVECHEVKGSYRLHSHQRAKLAFDQAATEWPGVRFVWAERSNGSWKTTTKGPL